MNWNSGGSLSGQLKKATISPVYSIVGICYYKKFKQLRV